MKQNERLLVYAVTGFLAVILLIAVWFGGDASAGARQSGAGDRAAHDVRGLGDLIEDGADGGATNGGATNGGATNGPAVAPIGEAVASRDGQPPLVAKGTAMVAAELLAQQVGPSRREREVRWVTARAGDSLETLTVRWCGSRDFVEAAMRMNEDLRVVQIGKEVAVPWVDDEVVLEFHENRQAKKLAAVPFDQMQPASAVTNPAPAAGNRGASRIDSLLTPATTEPEIRQPGGPVATEKAPSSAVPSGDAIVGGMERYTVKSGDSLWRIADRKYGRNQADRMVTEIKRANPGQGSALQPGQILLLPAK